MTPLASSVSEFKFADDPRVIIYDRNRAIIRPRALPSNSKTQLERVSKVKCSSLLGLVFSDEGDKFYNIDTRGQCYKNTTVNYHGNLLR